MDFNVNNAAKIYPQPVIKDVAPPPEKEAPKEKKKDSPVINNLSAVIANANKTPVENKEDSIMTSLTGIDAELTAMEKYLNDFNAKGQLTIEETGKLLAQLEAMQQRLNEIEKEIQELMDMYKNQDKEASKQMDQLSQVNLLRQQIEAQRALQKQGQVDTTTPSPQNNQAPKAV